MKDLSIVKELSIVEAIQWVMLNAIFKTIYIWDGYEIVILIFYIGLPNWWYGDIYVDFS